MSTPGTAAELSPQEASDLLHKLLTEGTKVKAVFARKGNPVGMSPPVAWVTGTFRLGHAGILMVSPDADGRDFALTFEPRAAASVRCRDKRVLRAPEHSRLLSGLIFSYEDYLVVLFEVPGM